MKLSAALALTVCLHASAGTFAQKVTWSGRQVAIEKVFAAVEQQTAFVFFFNYGLLQNAHAVSLEAKDLPLREFLDLLLRDQPLDYTIHNKTIVISAKTAISPEDRKASANRPPADIHGRIVNEQGEPVAGASISVKGSNRGTESDIRGEFSLKNLTENAVLVVSYVGFNNKEIAVGNKNEISITLTAAVNALDETVIIGYGKTSRRLNTGSVSTVTGKTIGEQPVTDPLAALQGRAPGLNITATNGLAGSNYQVRIRGENSIKQGNDPLYIIDGVPFISTPLNQFNGANGTQSPLASINPNDIERIDILKDADATAIYGSRGANGVILISTKKGKAGKTDVNVNIYTGASKVTRMIDMLNTKDYLALRQEAFRNDSVEPTPDNAPDLLVWDQNKNTNWQKLIFGNTAQLTQAQMSISGGSERTSFLISGTFHDEGTVLPGSNDYKRGSAHFNIDHSSLDRKFNVTASVNYSLDKNNSLPTDISQFYNLAPNYPLYNADGSYYWFNNEQNPEAYLLRGYQTQTNNLIGNTVLRYTILPGLNIKASLGYTQSGMQQLLTLPDKSFNPESSPGSSAQYGFSNVKSYIAEPQADYTIRLGRGDLQVLGGASWQQSISEGHSLYGTGYSSDALLKNMLAASSLTALNYNYAQYNYESVFGRINYNWAQKYIINATFRRDGSSRFGPDNRFGNFGSVGAAWLFTNEHFIQNALPFLSSGKLRASYGTTGNDQIGDYQYLDSWSSAGYPYGSISGLYPTRLLNAKYSWEVNHKLEGAVELGFLKDRILFSADYYNNRSGNQLLGYNLSPQAGFDSYIANLPAKVENSGWELELNTINIKNKDLSWTSSFNITIPKNKLLSYPNLDQSADAFSYVVGQSIRIVKGFHFTGVDPQTGLPQFLDVNKDGAVSEGDDYVVIGNTLPHFYGGFQNDISYKGFQLSIFFQFVKQEGPTYDYGVTATPYGAMNNKPVAALQRWQQPGDITAIPRASESSGNDAYELYSDYYTNSDAAWGDASYIRLKNLSLSYDLSHWTKALKIENSAIFFQAQNLFTITHYKGFDPETKGFDRTNVSEVLPFGTIRPVSVPTLKIYTLGLRFSL